MTINKVKVIIFIVLNEWREGREDTKKLSTKKLSNMKTLPKNIKTKIELINSLIETVNNADELPYTYNGGTWPVLVLIKPIEIKNQFVTITNDKGTFINGKERYNINKVSICGDEYCKKHLEYTLNVIIKTFKKVL